MASNFKIHVQRYSKELHLKLKGDFDGMSAHQVLITLRKYCRCCTRIFVHTRRLNHILPFGRRVFLSNLEFVTRRSVQLVFTGENASQLSP